MSEMIKPKFLEGIELTKSYYDVPNPYCDFKSSGINLLELSRYARAKNKKLVELTLEEVEKFKTTC